MESFVKILEKRHVHHGSLGLAQFQFQHQTFISSSKARGKGNSCHESRWLTSIIPCHLVVTRQTCVRHKPSHYFPSTSPFPMTFCASVMNKNLSGASEMSKYWEAQTKEIPMPWWDWNLPITHSHTRTYHKVLGLGFRVPFYPHFVGTMFSSCETLQNILWLLPCFTFMGENEECGEIPK